MGRGLRGSGGYYARKGKENISSCLIVNCECQF